MTGQPYITVKIEGVDVTSRLARVVLDEDEFRADALAVTLFDPTPIYIDVLHEPMSVELELGTPDDHPVAFRGKIWRVEAEFTHPSAPLVTVHAMDNLAQLSAAPKTARHWGVTLSAVVQQLTAAAGLLPGTISIPHDAVAPEELPLQQSGESDLAFLLRLTRIYNCRLYLEHAPGGLDLLHVRPVAELMAAKPLEKNMIFPTGISYFAPTFDQSQTVKALKVYGADRATGAKAAPVEAKPANTGSAAWTLIEALLAQVPEEDRTMITQLALKGAAHRANPTSNWPGPWELKAQPPAGSGSVPAPAVDESRWRGQEAWADGPGYHLVRPRVPVTISGVGGRFSGSWYVARAIHTVDVKARTYQTRFRCCR